MERCPNCGARCDGSQPCRRCGLELAPLLAVEEAAERLIGGALVRLAQGDAAGALSALDRSRNLRRDPLSDILLGFARAEAAGARLAEVAAIAPSESTERTPASVPPWAWAAERRSLLDLPDWPIAPTSESRSDDQAS